MNFFKKLRIVLGFFFVGSTIFGATMLPMKFDKRIDGNGGYQEYQIENPTNDTVRYKIYRKAESKDLTEKGIVGGMEKWIDFYPKIITIPPKTKGIVKVAIKAPVTAKTGEYVARIGTTPLAIPKVGKSGEAIEAQISLPLGVEMQIFGYVGDIEPKLEGDLKVKNEGGGTFIKGKIINNGTAGISILASYRYSNESGMHGKIVPLGRIMPGTEVEIDTSLLNEKGKKHKAIVLEIKEDGGSKTFLSVKP